MARMRVKRKPTVANQRISFEFEENGFVFLVKNFTDSDILVWFDEECPNEEKILIRADEFEEIEVNRGLKKIKDGSRIVNVLPEATDSIGVEVQLIMW